MPISRDILDRLLVEGKITQNLYDELIETGKFTLSTIVDKRIYVTLILEHLLTEEMERYIEQTYNAKMLYTSEVAPIATVEIPVDLTPVLILDEKLYIVRAYETPSIEPLEYSPDSSGWYNRNSVRISALEKISLEEIKQALGIDELHKQGFLGEGVVIALIDSGIDANHPMLKGHIRNAYSVVDEEPTNDELGHGCISGDSYIFTNNFGMKTIKDVYDILNNEYESYKKETGEIIDLSNENLYTIGFDKKNKTAVKTRIRAIHKIPINGKVIKINTGKGSWLVTPWHPYLLRHPEGYYYYKKSSELCFKNGLATVNKPISLNDEYQKIVIDSTSMRSIQYLNDYNKVIEIYKSCKDVKEIAKMIKRHPTTIKRWINGNKQHTEVKRTIIIDEKIGYFLGLVMADGHIDTKGTRSDIFCETKEEADMVSTFFMETFNHKTKSYWHGYCWQVYIPIIGQKLCKKLGIKGDKRYSTFIPEIIFRSPSSVQFAFIAGMIDGDGCYGKYGVRISSSSRTMSNQMPALLSLLGTKSSVAYRKGGRKHTINGKKSIEHEGWQICVSGRYMRELQKHINPYLLYKKNPEFHFTKSAMRTDKHVICVNNKKEIDFNGFFYDLTTDAENYAVGSSEGYNHVTFIHNTHVGSIIAYLVPKAQIDWYKIFKTTEGSIDQAMWSIERAAISGVPIVNMSWGASEFPPVDLLVETLNKQYGTIFIAAAGNVNLDGVTSPARSSGAVAVGSVSLRNPKPFAIAEFSSKGPEVDIVGFGGSDGEVVEAAKVGGGLIGFRGTSQSTPEVSAAAALLYKKFGKDVKDRLIQSAIDLGSKGADTNFGFGLLNVIGALSGEVYREKVTDDEKAAQQEVFPPSSPPSIRERPPELDISKLILAGTGVWLLLGFIQSKENNIYSYLEDRDNLK